MKTGILTFALLLFIVMDIAADIAMNTYDDNGSKLPLKIRIPLYLLSIPKWVEVAVTVIRATPIKETFSRSSA